MSDLNDPSKSKRLVLYYVPQNLQCRAVLQIIKYLNLNVKLKFINFDQLEHVSSEFIIKNPQSTVPVFEDNDITLYEGRAILTYLATVYGPQDDSLCPSNPILRAKIDQKLFFDNGILEQRLKDFYFPTLYYSESQDNFMSHKLQEALHWLDTQLKGQLFVACDLFTVADISIVSTITQIVAFGYNINPYLRIKQWFQKCTEILEPHDYHEINEVEAQIMAAQFKTNLSTITLQSANLNESGMSVIKTK